MTAQELEALLRGNRGNVRLDVRLDSDGTVDIFSEYEHDRRLQTLAVLDQPSLETAAIALAKKRRRA